jgi:hypothetical protein
MKSKEEPTLKRGGFFRSSPNPTKWSCETLTKNKIANNKNNKRIDSNSTISNRIDKELYKGIDI